MNGVFFPLLISWTPITSFAPPCQARHPLLPSRRRSILVFSLQNIFPSRLIPILRWALPSRRRKMYGRPSRKRGTGAWTEAEDARLFDLVSTYGTKNWVRVEQAMKGRDKKQCRERWCNHVDPNINDGPFSNEESIYIIDSYIRYGRQWARMSRCAQLANRPDNAIKNHFNTNLRDHYAELCRTLDIPRRLPNDLSDIDQATYERIKACITAPLTVSIRGSKASRFVVGPQDEHAEGRTSSSPARDRKLYNLGNSSASVTSSLSPTKMTGHGSFPSTRRPSSSTDHEPWRPRTSSSSHGTVSHSPGSTFFGMRDFDDSLLSDAVHATFSSGGHRQWVTSWPQAHGMPTASHDPFLFSPTTLGGDHGRPPPFLRDGNGRFHLPPFPALCQSPSSLPSTPSSTRLPLARFRSQSEIDQQQKARLRSMVAELDGPKRRTSLVTDRLQTTPRFAPYYKSTEQGSCRRKSLVAMSASPDERADQAHVGRSHVWSQTHAVGMPGSAPPESDVFNPPRCHYDNDVSRLNLSDRGTPSSVLPSISSLLHANTSRSLDDDEDGHTHSSDRSDYFGNLASSVCDSLS